MDELITWNDATYKTVTYALVKTIGDHAEGMIQAAGSANHLSKNDFYQNAARHTIGQVADATSQEEIAPVLQLGGEKFCAYLAYAKDVTKPSKEFKPFHKLIRDFSKKFDKIKTKHLEEFKINDTEVNAVVMCLETARTNWSMKNSNKISKLYGKLAAQ